MRITFSGSAAAAAVGVHLAMLLGRATARAVQEPLRAPGHRTDTAVLRQHAIAAAQAFLGPDRLLLENAEELSVESGVDGLSGEPLGDGLHARAAAEGDDGFGLGHLVSQVLDELVLALALDGDLGEFEGLALDLAGHAGGGGGDAHLALATGEADGDAGATAHEEDLAVARDEVLELGDGLRRRDDHGFPALTFCVGDLSGLGPSGLTVSTVSCTRWTKVGAMAAERFTILSRSPPTPISSRVSRMRSVRLRARRLPSRKWQPPSRHPATSMPSMPFSKAARMCSISILPVQGVWMIRTLF